MNFHGTNLELQRNDIESNSHKRKLYKRFMNSCIGKFAQQKQFPETKFVRSAEEIDKILEDGEIITDFNTIGESVCRVETEPGSEKKCNRFDRKANPIITAFVTALSRIDMHKNIVLLVEKGFTPLYTDTDSLIFFGPTEKNIPLATSPILGDFKEEFNKTLRSFCCIGKKNYAVTMASEKNMEETVLKVRGLSFHSKTASNKICFNDFKKFLSRQSETLPVIPQTHLKLKKNPHSVSKEVRHMRIATQLNFGRVLTKSINYTTVPYGFKGK